MTNTKLRVVIPTFNRNDILEENLKLLLPQLEDQNVPLLILDNCSPIPVAESLSKLLSKHPKAEVHVSKHEFNLGGNCNIVMAAVMSDAEYVWILGDDDKVDPDAIIKIKKSISANPDCFFYGFNSDSEVHPKRNSSINTVGAGELLDSIGTLPQGMFISDSIYNMDKIGPYLRFAMFYQSTCAPLFSALLIALRSEGKCFLSNEKIVSYGGEDTPAEKHLSNIPIVMGISKLLELPVSPECIQKLKRHLVWAQKYWIRHDTVFHQVLLKLWEDKDQETARRVYKALEEQYFSLDSSFFAWLKRRACFVALCYPKLTLHIISFYSKIIKRKTYKKVDSRDRLYL